MPEPWPACAWPRIPPCHRHAARRVWRPCRSGGSTRPAPGRPAIPGRRRPRLTTASGSTASMVPARLRSGTTTLARGAARWIGWCRRSGAGWPAQPTVCAARWGVRTRSASADTAYRSDVRRPVAGLIGAPTAAAATKIPVAPTAAARCRPNRLSHATMVSPLHLRRSAAACATARARATRRCRPPAINRAALSPASTTRLQGMTSPRAADDVAGAVANRPKSSNRAATSSSPSLVARLAPSSIAGQRQQAERGQPGHHPRPGEHRARAPRARDGAGQHARRQIVGHRRARSSRANRRSTSSGSSVQAG